MQFTKDTCTMSKNEAKALLGHASKDPARMSLCAVVFNLTQQRVWATDGHRLLVATREDGDRLTPRTSDDMMAMVPRDLIEAAVKTAKSRDTIRLRFTDERKVELMVRYAGEQEIVVSHDARRDDVTPPPVSQIIPRFDRVVEPNTRFQVGVNAHYLADIGLIAKLGNSGCVAVEINITTPDEPMLIRRRYADEPTWILLIMPMRI